MTLPTPTDLQAARKAAAERFYAIGMAHVPAGYTIKFRKALTGRHWAHQKLIEGPKPITRKALYIWLHECAHAHLHPVGCNKRSHVKELEAELWAHAKMRLHGVPVPKAMTERARAYVGRKIEQAEKHGAKTIDAGAVKFAKRRPK